MLQKFSFLNVRGILATPLLFSCCTFSMLHWFHVALFSCCIHVARFFLAMLQSSYVALVYYWTILQMNERQKTQPKSDFTLSSVNLFLFWYSVTRFLSLCSFEWLIKWKGTNLLFRWKKIYLPRLETFKTRVWIEIYFSPTWNILQIF